jgi:hypothetical protein
MAYSASKIEFLRFGSQHGGEGIGCCAVDIIQGFVNDPEAPASVQLYHGDRGGKNDLAMTLYVNGKSEFAYLGKTNREVFENFVRIGTFGTADMPDHTFFAVFSDSQMSDRHGQAWLKILKDEGFAFIRTVGNSIYTDKTVPEEPVKGETRPHKNHIFGLFRNISNAAVADPFTPPAAWSKIPEPTMTPHEIWHSRKTKIYGESEIKGHDPAETKAASNPFAAKAVTEPA